MTFWDWKSRLTCPAAVKLKVRFAADIKGKQMDFWKIYDEFYGPVRKFILAYVKDEWVADDLIQETFLKVQKNLDGVRDPAKLSSWIFRIAYNVCHDHFRQAKRSSAKNRAIQQEIVTFKEALV